MPSFDYITSSDLRASLESDHAEMLRCSDAGAWKSVQVLAGSIVECLLIDYLVAFNSPTRTKDPLKIDLGEAISICRSEGVLTDRTSDMCSVIRSYRNLIHPGRVLRLGEDAPSKTTSTIAIALVEIIAGEVAKFRRASVGLTAEQVLSKLIRDEHSITVLKHTLPEVSDLQRRVLLMESLPKAYIDVENDSFEAALGIPVGIRLSEAFRVVFDASSDDIKRAVCAKFVRMVREDSSEAIKIYREAFFRSRDIRYLDPAAVPMIKAHLLEAYKFPHTITTLKLIEGLCEFLLPSECATWLDPILRTIGASGVPPHVKKRAHDVVVASYMHTSKEFDEQVKLRLGVWIKHYETAGYEDAHKSLVQLLEDYEIPF